MLDHIDRELPSLEHLELKFGLSSEFFNKIPVSILLDVLFRVFRFFKASFYALASSFMTFWNFVAILTLGRTEGCHGNFCNFTLSLKFRAKIKDYDISVLSSRIRIQISHKSYVIVAQLWTTRPGVCSLTLIFCLNYHHYFLDVSSLRKKEHTDLYTPHPSAK